MCVGRQRAIVVDGDLVVAHDAHVLPQLAEVLHEVVGERVVVVDHEQHQLLAPRGAARARDLDGARRTARALLTHSSYSAPGSLSATMPAPACT